MPFVLDTSVVMAWCFEDESSEYADSVLNRFTRDAALVPSIWPLEVANALLMAERRQRLKVADIARISTLLRALPISVAEVPHDRAVGALLDLARAHGLTSYDAAYLDLAMREGVPLATQDKRLQAVASTVGVSLLPQ